MTDVTMDVREIVVDIQYFYLPSIRELIVSFFIALLCFYTSRFCASSDCPFPTKDVLDSAFPDNPLFLVRIDGHCGWANDAAIKSIPPLPVWAYSSLFACLISHNMLYLLLLLTVLNRCLAEDHSDFEFIYRCQSWVSWFLLVYILIEMTLLIEGTWSDGRTHHKKQRHRRTHGHFYRQGDDAGDRSHSVAVAVHAAAGTADSSGRLCCQWTDWPARSWCGSTCLCACLCL